MTIDYYRISIPHSPVKEERFNTYKSKVNLGQKIDFYGKPSYRDLCKEKGLLSGILAAILFIIWIIMCLFEWKINFEELKGFISLFLVLSIFTFLIPFLTFIQLRHDIRVFRACLNFVRFLLDASFITPKTGTINASFISIKYKNKIYRPKRSTNIFSDENLNRLLIKMLLVL